MDKKKQRQEQIIKDIQKYHEINLNYRDKENRYLKNMLKRVLTRAKRLPDDLWEDIFDLECNDFFSENCSPEKK